VWESKEESEAAAGLSLAGWLLFFGLLLLFGPILFIAQSARPNAAGEHSDVWLILAVCSIWCVVLPVAWSTRVAIGRGYHRDQNWTPKFGVAESAVGSQLCFFVGSGVVYSVLDGWVDTGVILVFFVVAGGILAVGVGYSFRFLRSGSTRPQQETKSPVDPPTGCRFRTRCRFADERCAVEEPKMRELAPDHHVACHHPLTSKDIER